MKNKQTKHLFKYCPRCGSSAFNWHDDKSKECKDCNFIYYFNISAAVVAFIVDKKNKLLICKRKEDPQKGMLDLPGGFVDKNETAEEALVREIKEELNIEVLSLKYLFSLPNIYHYSGFDVHTLDVFFQVQIKDMSKVKASDDVEEFYFKERKDIEIEEFGFQSIKKAIKMYLNTIEV